MAKNVDTDHTASEWFYIVQTILSERDNYLVKFVYF